MTYIEALAEKIGVKEATRAAFKGCPGDHFKDGAKVGDRNCIGVGCSKCWLAEMPEDKEE